MTEKGPGSQTVDLCRLIRSIQHIEGNPDCFGRSDGSCDRTDCCWRSYCLKISREGVQQKAAGKAAGEVKNGKSKKKH